MRIDEWLVLLGAIATIALVNWYFFLAGRRVVAVAATDGAPVPEVRITVDNGYSPAAIGVKAGRRTRLVFERRDDSSCSEEVVFADFGIKRFLPKGEPVAIDIEPPAPGRYGFTCGMGMLRGTVIADA